MKNRKNTLDEQLAFAREFCELRRRCRLGRLQVALDASMELRDALAAQLNCGLTGRTLETLAKLLNLPEPVLRAIPHRVTKNVALQILERPTSTQEAIAKDLQSGMSREALLGKYQLIRCGAHKSTQALFAELLRLTAKLLSLSLVDAADLALVEVRGLDATHVLGKGIQLLTDIYVIRNSSRSTTDSDRTEMELDNTPRKFSGN